MNLGGVWVGSLADNSFGGLRGGDGYWFVAPDLGDDEIISFEFNNPSGSDLSRDLISKAPETAEGFEYTQSTQQGFYFVQRATFDEVDISIGDVIVAYNDNVVVGSWAWSGAFTTVPAMGYDDHESTAGYMLSGQVPTFKLLSVESGELIDLDVIGEIEPWANNGVSVIELAGSTPVPSEISLSDAYPNPFNPSTSFDISMPTSGFLSVKVYNVSGQMVDVIANGIYDKNTHSFTWNASGMPSGMYVIHAELNGMSISHSISLINYIKLFYK
jgi:hypothetical protein